jgi:N-acetylglucosamine kinase-like BadF-type ATPase
MQYFVGIDGGGTKSRLVIGNSKGEKLFIAQGDSTNIFSVGLDKSFAALNDLINSSFAKYKIKISEVERICVASAGLAREFELTEFKKFFSNNYPNLKVIFTTDVMALMVGSLDDKDGICLISGTGSVAIGQNGKGQILRAGGFGWKLGDEGSASNIALEAVRRIIRSSENRDLQTNMTRAILNHFGLVKIEDTIKFFHNPYLDKATVASAASIVTDFARKGDLLAIDILQKGATELFNLVFSVQNRLTKIDNRILVTAGGVFEHDEILKDFFNMEIEKYNLEKGNKFGKIQQTLNKGNALDGALHIAIKEI